MHEFTGVEIHSAMAMSVRPPNCVPNGGHKGIWFSERIRTRMHPEPYQLSIESGAMATAERFNFEHISGILTRMRGIQHTKLCMKVIRNDIHTLFAI